MADEQSSIGVRIRAAREAIEMKQEELALKVGFASRQIISDLERGNRDVKAAEAVRIAKALRVDLWTLLGEPVTEPVVLWRERPVDGAAAIQAEFLRWCDRDRRVLRLLEQEPADRLPSFSLDPASATYADAEELARQVGGLLSLGLRPARTLADAVASEFDVTIWYLDTPAGSAACTRGRQGAAILVPRAEAPWRRTFDVAHELFHLITWAQTVPPASQEAAQPSERAEQLANAFAARLLLPAEIILRELAECSVSKQMKLAELVALAREFGVSIETLVWRIHNLGYWGGDRSAVEQLLGNPRLRDLDRASQRGQWWEPHGLPERFVQAGYSAALRGRLSRAQLATYLGCSLPDLPACLADYGIDEGFAELVSQDVPCEPCAGDVEPSPLSCERK
jgi:transcriptional regulator with XRE-family HTH domain